MNDTTTDTRTAEEIASAKAAKKASKEAHRAEEAANTKKAFEECAQKIKEGMSSGNIFESLNKKYKPKEMKALNKMLMESVKKMSYKELLHTRDNLNHINDMVKDRTTAKAKTTWDKICAHAENNKMALVAIGSAGAGVLMARTFCNRPASSVETPGNLG